MADTLVFVALLLPFWLYYGNERIITSLSKDWTSCKERVMYYKRVKHELQAKTFSSGFERQALLFRRI